MSHRKSALSACLAAGVLVPVLAHAQESFSTTRPSVAAPTTLPSAAAAEVPTAAHQAVGEITASSVNVRSGPADSYYVTSQLKKGDKVRVVGHRFDWLKIIPPEGSFSYIAKAYVDRDPAGNSGTVSRNQVLVHAGSQRNQLKSSTQTTLSAGAKVQIIGEQDEYYKIKPPEGAYLYVSKQFVQLVSGAAGNEVAAAPENQPATTTPPSEEKVWQEATGMDSSTAPVAPRAADVQVQPPTQERALAGEAASEFKRVEQQFESTKTKPVEDRPIAEMRSAYEALAKNPALLPSARATAQNRIVYLTALQEQADAIAKLKQERGDFTARQGELEQQARQVETRLKEAGIATYTAVGQLQISTLQRDSQPLLRLVDPADNRTLVYVKYANDKQRNMIDKFVGVRGEVSRDVQLSVDVIEPTEVEAVDQARVFKGVSARIYPPSLLRGSSNATTQP